MASFGVVLIARPLISASRGPPRLKKGPNWKLDLLFSSRFIFSPVNDDCCDCCRCCWFDLLAVIVPVPYDS